MGLYPKAYCLEDLDGLCFDCNVRIVSVAGNACVECNQGTYTTLPIGLTQMESRPLKCYSGDRETLENQ